MIFTLPTFQTFVIQNISPFVMQYHSSSCSVLVQQILKIKSLQTVNNCFTDIVNILVFIISYCLKIISIQNMLLSWCLMSQYKNACSGNEIKYASFFIIYIYIYIYNWHNLFHYINIYIYITYIKKKSSEEKHYYILPSEMKTEWSNFFYCCTMKKKHIK